MELLRILTGICVLYVGEMILILINYGVLEKNVILGNLKIIWDIDQEKVDINCDQRSFIRSNNGSHLNITMWRFATGAPANTVNRTLID